jgi:ribosomal protein L11 methyltransferase
LNTDFENGDIIDGIVLSTGNCILIKNQLNAIENGVANDVEFSGETGDAALLEGRTFDVILANINRNVLVADISAYKASLKAGGIIFLSGFLTTDVELISNVYNQAGFQLLSSSVEGDWNCLVFKL